MFDFQEELKKMVLLDVQRPSSTQFDQLGLEDMR